MADLEAVEADLALTWRLTLKYPMLGGFPSLQVLEQLGCPHRQPVPKKSVALRDSLLEKAACPPRVLCMKSQEQMTQMDFHWTTL